MVKKSLFVLLVLITLTGCIEKEVLDEISLITILGYDKGEGEEILGTVVVPQYKKDQPIENKMMTVEGDLSRDIMSKMQKESADPLVYGKLQLVLYHIDIAKEGVQPLIDSIERDASVGSRVILAVSKNNVNKLLQADYGQQGNAAYLTKMIRQNMQLRDLPENNLHLYLYSLYTDGKDPFMPIIEQNGNENIKIQGLALFQNDKMVGEIPNKKLPIFKMFVDQYVKGTYSLKLEDGTVASLQSIKSNRKMIYSDKDEPKITVELTVKGHVREYSKAKVSKKDLNKIEKTFEKEIEENGQELITLFQSLQVDPVGFGDFIKSRSRKKFKQENPFFQTKLEVKANVKVIETGVVE
ncbi:Ger(x)C family spore germination protein [Bacillus sp. FJAT-47783]|uniref:Ger(x)C family spore germination protein n=1 Tax=Bacillus sp. FJAT-47783 TaxID=2922712 RepID=UPI001FADFF3C|nr:Ger(x)C family spore germination protein [Bacillus sp. FJAT-47783]